jgi:hypothetical protein
LFALHHGRVNVVASASKPSLERTERKEAVDVGAEGDEAASTAPSGGFVAHWVDDRRAWANAAASLVNGKNDGSKGRLIKSASEMIGMLEKVGIKNIKYVDEEGKFTKTGWVALVISLWLVFADVSFAVITLNQAYKFVTSGSLE